MLVPHKVASWSYEDSNFTRPRRAVNVFRVISHDENNNVFFRANSLRAGSARALHVSNHDVIGQMSIVWKSHEETESSLFDTEEVESNNKMDKKITNDTIASATLCPSSEITRQCTVHGIRI
jgi:hypothetical protein